MKLVLDKVQEEIVERMAKEPTRAALNASETGCIQGDAVLTVNRGGKSFQITLKDLVHMYNGGERGRWGRGYTWDERIPTRVQRRAKDGTVRLSDIVGAWYSGPKMTYTVTTKGGRTIRATDEHPFYTGHGWRRLDELHVGSRVWVAGDQQSGRPRKPKNHYLYRNKLKFHPHARSTKNQPDLRRVATHRLVVEADMNGLAFEEYLNALRTGDGVEVFKFLDPRSAVHHKDQNHKNNALSNLEVYSHEEHARLHSREFQSHVLQKTELDVVVSIKPFGIEDTYDIEVADDPHNFIANGFVVHNTGKTIMAVELAKRIGAETVLVVGPANPKVVGSWRSTFERQEYPHPFVKIEKGNHLDVDYRNPLPGVYYVSKEFATRHDSLGKHERDIPWNKSGFDMVIADEAHFGTNRKSQVSKVLKRLGHSGYRLALSATPQGSKFEGFWSLCRFLWPKTERPNVSGDMRLVVDTSFHRWAATWCEFETIYVQGGRKITKVKGPKGDDPSKFTSTLPCYVSLKKDELPTHTIFVEVDLSPEQRRVYDTLLEEAVVWLSEQEDDALIVDYPITKRIRLRQTTLAQPIVSDEGEVEFDHDAPSSKADAIRYIRSLHPDDRIIVYTTSEKFTRLLAEREEKSVLWTGPVPKKTRERNLEKFFSGEATLLIATYTAISEGMDGLQHACNIEVWADDPDSSVVATQVAGRLNRRGQKAPEITRYRLQANDTADVEDFDKLVVKIKNRKEEL